MPREGMPIIGARRLNAIRAVRTRVACGEFRRTAVETTQHREVTP